MKKNVFYRVAVFALLLFACVGCRPTSPDECLQKGVIAIKSGNYSKALKLAEIGLKLAPKDSDMFVLKALACEGLGEEPMAVDAALSAVNASGDNMTARYTLGRLYAKDIRRDGKTMQILVGILNKLPNDRNTLVLLSNVLVRSQVYSRFAGRYLDQLAVKPEFSRSSALQNQYGVMFCRQRRYAAARRCFENALQLVGDNPVIFLNLARLHDYYFADSKGPAKTYYRQFIERAGKNSAYTSLVSASQNRLMQLETYF